MRQKQFYSHLIDLTSLTLALADMAITPKERLHLLSLMEANMHNHILEAVLDELPEEDKRVFLQHLLADDHEQIWQVLQKHMPQIEEKIVQTANELKKELHKDIEEASK